jgi:ribosomal subunit interface protein
LHVYLTARHLRFSPSLHAYVEKHLIAHIRRHFARKIPRVEVQLFREAAKHIGAFGCHVLVQIAGEPDINVREVDERIHEAIDLAEARVVRTLAEDKDRMITVRRQRRR